MEIFLDRYHIPKLNQKQRNIFNRPITHKELKDIKQKSTNRKQSPKAKVFQFIILPEFQRRDNTNIPQIVPHHRNRRDIAKLFFQAALPKPNKDATRKIITGQSTL